MKEGDLIQDSSEQNGMFDLGDNSLKDIGSRIGLFIVLMLLMASVAVNIFEIRRRENYRQVLDDISRRALYQASGNVDDMLSQLDKVKLAKRPDQSAPIFAEIWKQSTLARDNLSQVSSADGYINSTLAFLSDVSSLSHELMLKAIDGSYLENDDWKKLAAAEANTAMLSEKLRTVSTDVSSNMFAAEVITENMMVPYRRLSGESNIIPSTGTRSSGASSSINDNFSVSSEDGRSLTPEEGKGYAESFFIAMCESSVISATSFLKTSYLENFKTQMVHAVHSYEILLSDGQRLYIDISAETGAPVMMIRDYMEITGEAIEQSAAIGKAAVFIEAIGFTDMHPIFYETFGDYIYIDFIREENGIFIYPDEIKVKMHLFSGRIEAFNSLKYHQSHHPRDIKRPVLMEETALELISSQLDVQNIALAIISGSDSIETLCYEFDGYLSGGYYAVFINAANGRQEMIRRLYLETTLKPWGSAPNPAGDFDPRPHY